MWRWKRKYSTSADFRFFIFTVLVPLSAATPTTQDQFREAVRAGDQPVVIRLIPESDLDARDPLGAAALHDAVWSGRVEIVRLLLQAGADPNITHLEAGSTPLDYAAVKNEPEIAQLLLDRGANVRAVNRSGSTALHLAAARGYTAVARLLLDHGASIQALDGSGSTPLEEAAWKGFAEMCALLLDRGALVNALNPETGKSPLNEAASNGHLAAARLLLARGVDPSLADKSGATPLQNAARLNDGDIVSILLTGKNSISAADLLDNAVLEGQSEIARLLIEHGADVNAPGKSGSTPLGDAALKGRLELARLLLSRGARVDAVNRFGSMPLHDAALSGNSAVVELLLAAGAPINAQDRESGATPLYNAASMGHPEVVSLLLARGADPELSTKAGSTPLHAALANNFPETAALLRSQRSAPQK